MAESIENKAQNFLQVVKFNAYQAPDFQEVRGKEYIKCGEKNDYLEYLVKLYQRSSKHSAIINGKVDYISGEGWINGADPNAKETLREFTNKIVLDLEIFNGFAIEVKKSKGGSKQLFHVSFHHLRTNADQDKFFYTRNWASYRPEKNDDWKELKAYNGTEGLFYFTNYSPKVSQFPVYPLPEYIGSIPYIEIDYKIADFHLNNVSTGIWGNVVFNFLNGVPSDEKQKEIEKSIEKKFSGESGKRFMLNFADGKERGMELLFLNSNDTDKLFEVLNKTVQQEIFVGHKVTSPMLFGIRTEGQLGGRSEIVEAYEMFKKSYIKNRQVEIEEAMNYILSGTRTGAMRLKEKQPISLEIPITEATITANLDRTEIRTLITKQYGIQLGTTPALPPALPAKAQFSAETEQRVIAKFEKAGTDSDDYEVLKVRRVWFNTDSEVIEKEIDLYKQCFATPVTGKITDYQLGILKILDKNPDATTSEIAKSLKIAESKVADIIAELIDAGYVEETSAGLSVTTDGGELVPPERTMSSISVKYRYAKDPSLPGPDLLPTSRPLCVRLIEMNKLYDRKEIEQISAEEDYSVFLFRGGWYHNPKTGDNTPYCRHIWEQIVVVNKRK